MLECIHRIKSGITIALLTFIGYTTCAQTDDKVLKIPVIFHVLYANERQNISVDSINAELNNLHNDFLLLNADTTQVNLFHKKNIGNPRIEFYLADTVLNKDGHRGINRVHTSANRHNLHRKTKIINPLKYLNVYVGNIRSDGFVNANSWADPAGDAIYLCYKWIGSHYRVLTHETGHWFGLWHVFEDGCTGTGDDISDTVPQSSSTDGDCDKCPPDVHDNTCGAIPSNFNNFMDYSGCRKMFTREQVLRMRKIIREHRPAIWNTKD